MVDWLKSMVAKQKISFVVDPELPETPSTKELKRVILIALRCVDPEVKHRPKMGDVVHMLEPRDLLLNVVRTMAFFLPQSCFFFFFNGTLFELNHPFGEGVKTNLVELFQIGVKTN